VSDLFHTPCILHCENDPSILDQIIVGLRTYARPIDASPGATLDGVAMYTAAERGLFIPGGPLRKAEGGSYRLTDAARRNRMNVPLRWSFTPLTLESWDAYRQKHNVTGGDVLRAQVGDTNGLLNFYRQEFLPRGWEEEYLKDTRVPPEEPETDDA